MEKSGELTFLFKWLKVGGGGAASFDANHWTTPTHLVL